MFRNADRRRGLDRARVAPTIGHVGRNLGDQPYIMDLVLQEHFIAADPRSLPPTGTGSGTVEAVAGVTAARYSSGATAGGTIRADFGTDPNAIGMAGFNRDANLRARVRFSAVDSAASIFIGFALSNGLATAVDGLFLGVAGAVSTDYFIAAARNGGLATTKVLDGGGGSYAAPVDTIWHELSIICDSTQGEVRYYLDRQLVATINSDLPDDASDYFTPHLSAQNGATNTARYIDIDVLVLAEAAP
jgi:hypothetical protein